ncbi:MAG: hypothetical protein K6C69_04905 [Lachnospiraceae bacterium]|nr:hypothetical protein [Lachnospiraceae bacterium]
MATILELKEKIRVFYGKNEIFLAPLARFVLALITLSVINGNIGYMKALKNPMITIAIALICGIFPSGATVLFVTLVIVGHLYAESMELAVVALLVFILMYLFYFHFTAKQSAWVCVSLICCVLGVPSIVPVAAGLLAGAFTCIPVIFGVIIFYLMNYAKEYINTAQAVVSNSEGSDMFDNFLTIVTGVMDREIVLYAISFALTVVIVYVIRRLSIDYCWIYAIIAGCLTNFIMLLVGNSIFGTSISVGSMVVGLILSLVVGFVLMFLFFNVDYHRTERVQYEDEEYYYYVKAVPKYCVPAKNVRVNKIHTTRKSSVDEDDFDEIEIDS